MVGHVSENSNGRAGTLTVYDLPERAIATFDGRTINVYGKTDGPAMTGDSNLDGRATSDLLRKGADSSKGATRRALLAAAKTAHPTRLRGKNS